MLRLDFEEQLTLRAFRLTLPDQDLGLRTLDGEGWFLVLTRRVWVRGMSWVFLWVSVFFL